MCTCLVMFNSLQPPRTAACQALLSMEFSRQNTREGCHFFLQGIFSTRNEGQNPSHAAPALEDRFFTTGSPGNYVHCTTA